MKQLTLATLKGYVPFQAFTEARLSVLLDHCLPFYARKGQILMEPGKPQDHAYFLLAGEVKCLQSGRVLDARYAYPLHDRRQHQEVLLALTDCSLFQIERDFLDRFLCWSEAARYLEEDIACQREFDGQQEWMLTLLNSNLFYKVSPLNIQKIFMYLNAISVRQGDVMIRQGDLGDGCYLIREGEAVVTRQLGADTKSLVLARIGPGRCFGEDALLHETVRNATVTMCSNGTLMKMEKRDFVQLIKEPAVDTLLYSDLDVGLQTGSLLLDVRRTEEFQRQHLSGALSMPLSHLRLQARTLDPYGCYIVYCDTDRRSKAAAHFLSQQGLRVRALQGGLNHLPEDYPLLGSVLI